MIRTEELFSVSKLSHENHHETKKTKMEVHMAHFVFHTLCFFFNTDFSQSEKKKLKFNLFHLQSEGNLPFCFSKHKNLYRTQTFKFFSSSKQTV